MAEVVSSFDTAHGGVVHDAQLDYYGLRLATASADGHIRLWDTSTPEMPTFLEDLGKHSGAVCQVMWSPPEVGNLLASAGTDGQLLVWGPVEENKQWAWLHCEDLQTHGSLCGLEWAAAAHGPTLACASSSGVVTILSHQGTIKAVGDTEVAHHWQAQSFQAHPQATLSVSWASPPVATDASLGLSGARFASVAADDIRVWSWDDRECAWLQEHKLVPSSEASSSAKPFRSVAWKPWGGGAEVIAVAGGSAVTIWELHTSSGWSLSKEVPLGCTAWNLQWTDTGNVLLVSCGGSGSDSLLLKANLAGEWDVMEMSVREN
mmetsp:Transcript_15144/g.34480  ORF Transcript_15144/g.34480 Transcript_15144/m.34480 type:complete len:319 (+) Transcript_15144:80-1036(+)